MKKILLIATLALLVVSCDNSIEGKIKKEFKKYIELNFDNPNDITEIVSIEPIDSLNYDQLCKAMISSVEWLISTDSLYAIHYKYSQNQLWEKIDIIESKIKGGDYELGRQFNEVCNLHEDMAKYVAYSFYPEKAALIELKDELIDSTKVNINLPNLCVYKIKFRQKIEENIIMKEYYCYRDISTDDKKMNYDFKDHPMKINEISEYNEDLGKISLVTKGAINLKDEYISIRKKGIEAKTKLIYYINVNY